MSLLAAAAAGATPRLRPPASVQDAGAEVLVERAGAPAPWAAARLQRGVGQLDELRALELTCLPDDGGGLGVRVAVEAVGPDAPVLAVAENIGTAEEGGLTDDARAVAGV